MRTLLIAVLALGLFSCGDKDKKKPDPEELGAPELNGQWVSNCLQNSTPFSGPIGEKRIIKIEGTEVTTKFLLFRDDACSDSQIQLTLLKRSFTKFLADQTPGLFSIDDGVTGYYIIPANPTFADILTKDEFCGIKKWKSGKEYSVTNCKYGDENLFPAITRYTILKYDESTDPDTFVLGRFTNNENGSTPQNRPKTLGGDIHYRIAQ